MHGYIYIKLKIISNEYRYVFVFYIHTCIPAVVVILPCNTYENHMYTVTYACLTIELFVIVFKLLFQYRCVLNIANLLYHLSNIQSSVEARTPFACDL